jgi:Zn-dependent peptidase ImmA (M78 family)/DNA-binding XRE family transcriptional regulator
MEKKAFQGGQLKTARLLRGLTVTALADETGISKQSISLYENNENKPDYERGYKLAAALRVPYEFFLQKDACAAQTAATYFRSLASTSKLSRTSQSIKLEFIAKIYEALLNYIDFPVLNLPKIEFVGSKNDFDESENHRVLLELEQIAAEVRALWALGNGPIDDLQYALESNGVVVTGFDASENKIDAFSQRIITDTGEVCIIALNQGEKPEGRIRFDMAHELAHILIHPWSEDLDCISKEEFKQRETQANIFAGAFLLPRESFARDVQAHPTDLKYYQWLKKKWKVSVQAMVYRSHQLKIISTNQYQYMMRQISKNGWRHNEPGDMPCFIGENIFQGAIDLLKEEKILSIKSLLDLFSKYGVSLYPAEIEALLNLSPNTLQSTESNTRIIYLKK